MDVVIQFAIHKLGFQLNDIIIYAWSIGGFTGKQRRSLQCVYDVVVGPRMVSFYIKCVSLFFNDDFSPCLSHLGSDVIPRDQIRGAGCLL